MNAPRANADDAVSGRVSVRVPLPLGADYTYKVPEGWAVPPGALVRVPVGGRALWAAAWGPDAGEVDPKKLKDILEVADLPPLSAALRRFVDWVADYTLSPPGAVLRMVLSAPAALEAEVSAAGVTRAMVWPAGMRRTAGRVRLWAALVGCGPLGVADAARRGDVGDAVVRGMLAEGALVAAELPRRRFPAPDPDAQPVTFGSEQAAAAADLVARVGAGYSVTLLDGVTGSGKTEVYFEAIAEVVRRGGQALVLVPEIALTAQWLERFARRFGVAPAVWHSGLTPAQRRDTWRAVARGEAQVLIGARSGLFLPFADLGLIVVDEEHEQAFKQEDGVLYHGRDMAVVRAHVEGIPAVLASATPSLETLANARAGRYATLSLPKRHGGAEMPSVELVDLRATPPEPLPGGRNWLAPPLVAAIGEALEKGEQALLYLNRRGYAPLTLCRACGHRLQCPHCTAWLVEHRDRRGAHLQCHHCGYSARLPETCPECGAEESFVACGPGVERIAEEVARRFPEARRMVLASDQIGGPAEVKAALDAIAAGEVDVVVGTQMVAKGHHFPGLTLVGVIDADVGLVGGDLRAAERTFQLLHQVAGRAGRGRLHGKVLMQTFDPAQPVIAALAAGDRDAFVAAEQIGRKALGLPPFGRLAAVIVAARGDAEAEALARDIGRAFPGGEGVKLYGPAPAVLARLRGWSRWRLLVSAPRDVRMQPLLRGWMARVAIPRSARVRLDIDPYTFL